MKRPGGAVLLLLALAGRGGAQTPLRPGPCAAAPQEGEGWVDFSHGGLKLALRLPPELHQVDYNALPKLADRARRKEIPSGAARTAQLALAWEAGRKATGPVRQVLLYTAPGSVVPEGRPCAMTIAGSPGLVFRSALTSADHSSDEYWVEAYWPGFILAATGASASVYDTVVAILRSIAAAPQPGDSGGAGPGSPTGGPGRGSRPGRD